MRELETELSVPFSASMFTFIGLTTGGGCHGYITKRPQKEKKMCTHMYMYTYVIGF